MTPEDLTPQVLADGIELNSSLSKLYEKPKDRDFIISMYLERHPTPAAKIALLVVALSGAYAYYDRLTALTGRELNVDLQTVLKNVTDGLDTA